MCMGRWRRTQKRVNTCFTSNHISMLDQKLLETNIIQLLGLAALPDNRKVALLNRVTELVQKRLLLRIMDQLSETDKKALTDAIASGEPVKIDQALAGKVSNIMALAIEEIVKVKEELKGVVDEVKV